MADNFITVSPPELSFKFELRKNIPVTMQLTNTTGDRVAFKVKTTSPKKYCVRPSSGIIEPNAVKEVQVILQSQREYPVSYADCRDKFLVQCIKIDASVKEVTSELFADPTKAKDMKQTKLKVVMIPPAKPPSPVPEGNELEPTSPPFKGGVLPATSELTSVTEDKAAIQQQLDSRLRSLSRQQKAPQGAVATKRASSGMNYGLISLLLVAILAFVIGQVSQNALPDLIAQITQKFHMLKAKYM